jgi:hypothetical protein
MIQRIQTLYLLLAAGVLAAALFLPLGWFVTDAGLAVAAFKPLGVTPLSADGASHSTWGLFCILLLSAVILLATIFLYRNRMLQVRMAIFTGLLLVGYYLAFVVFLFMLKSHFELGYRIGWALCLPAVSIILCYLAFRAIYKDEVMVRASDRLRG